MIVRKFDDKVAFSSACGICILFNLFIFVLPTHGQGLNYPGNSPIMNTGAGNARADADNLFTRNNPAGLAEIEDEATGRPRRWRVFGEIQGTYYRYCRDQDLAAGSVRSQGTVAVPNGSAELTFTSRDKRYGFGVGISQVFGFQSKLKEPRALVGDQPQFFDTKIASHDMSLSAGYRLNKYVSVGGSAIVGRAFLTQIATIPELAAFGIIRQSRLDVSKVGGLGFSAGLNVKPHDRFRAGFYYKSRRKYDLTGSLDLVQPAGATLVNVEIPVRVPFRFPAIMETGISVAVTKRMHVAFDHRYYFYDSTLDRVNVLDRNTGSTIVSQTLAAKNVHLFLLGGFFVLDQNQKINFGTGLVTNAIPDETFKPGLMNTGGKSLTGGYSRRVGDIWYIASISAYFGSDRSIGAKTNPFFAGDYSNQGLTIGLGIRR